MRKQPAAVDTAIAWSLAQAKPVSFWLDQPEAPEALPALAETMSADLAVVGAGSTGCGPLAYAAGYTGLGVGRRVAVSCPRICA
jgi:hypothetical protein